jgi:hypothetical protein
MSIDGSHECQCGRLCGGLLDEVRARALEHARLRDHAYAEWCDGCNPPALTPEPGEGA